MMAQATSTEQSPLAWALNLLVLRVLGAGPCDGYGIGKTIRDVTEDALEIEEGVLYPALYLMERRDWISASWSVEAGTRRIRVYGLTASGRRQLAIELAGWRRFSGAVGQVVERL
jgi:PadR family transcriptional regulator